MTTEPPKVTRVTEVIKNGVEVAATVTVEENAPLTTGVKVESEAPPSSCTKVLYWALDVRLQELQLPINPP